MSAADGGAESEPEEQPSRETDAIELDMSQLASRIESVQDKVELEERLESLDQAWVLVFDADTDDEAVYSMEMSEEEGAHVVLAFEDAGEAQDYADHLREEEYEGDASVQALDISALVITSREADFRVGVVFRGDFKRVPKPPSDDTVSAFITRARNPQPEPMSLSITIVPEHIFEGRSSAEFLDPDLEPIWVLVHDEGTGDAQYFSMVLNGTSSVVCFKDAESADRCSEALATKGAEGASAKSIFLEELLESLDGDEMEVCLVDEVVETLVDDDGSGANLGVGIVAADTDDAVLGTFPHESFEQASQTSGANQDVRAMLEKMFDADA